MRKVATIKYDVILSQNVTVSFDNIFEGNNAVDSNCTISGSYFGIGTFIAPNSRIVKTKVGRYCSIGENVRTRFGLHPTREFVSTHPAFFSLLKQAGFTFVEEQLFEEHKYVKNDRMYFVEIGNDVWIGNDVKIMDGIKIGDGAVIGMGSIVTKDIEAYSINVGVPAKKIGYRFNEAQRKFLLGFKWWEKESKWIKKNAALFSDIEVFVDRMKSSLTK